VTGKRIDFDRANQAASHVNERKEGLSALVAYGSTQGKTGEVADAITEGLNAAGVRASAIRLDRLSLMPNRTRSIDILGVGSPVYYLREPAYMQKFIVDLPPLDGKKVFVFCTTGMNRVGETLFRLRQALAERGADVVGADSFSASMAYPPYRQRGLGNPEALPDATVLAEARQFGARMAKAPELQPVRLTEPSLATQLKARMLADPAFRRMLLPGVKLNTELCTGYGSCISRCYFSALQREDEGDVPVLTDACIQCLQCIASCPRGAIEVDMPIKESLSTVMYRLGIH